MQAAADATPSFLRLLRDERVHTVLIAGCGGGFDFMHSGHFIPMLLAWNKTLIFHSYSFGDPTTITGAAKFTADASVPAEVRESVPPMMANCAWPAVCVVDGNCVSRSNYGPEVALCSFLDKRFPDRAPKRLTFPVKKAGTDQPAAATGTPDTKDSSGEHKQGAWWLYASYARHWTAHALQHFYHTLAVLHDVDAILIIDGGSDSLMKGDEAGLGDPIEDAASVAAVASLPNTVPAPKTTTKAKAAAAAAAAATVDFVPVRVLVALGFGCDRFNTVEDRDSFAAIAELTALTRPPANAIETDHCGKDTSAAPHQPAMPGFLGVLAMERFSAAAQFYSDLIDFTQDKYSFRSVIANSIVETTRGAFGDKVVPPTLRGRVAPGQLDLWPLMSFAFAFDPRLMMRRSLLCPLLAPCKTTDDMYFALNRMRKELRR